MTQGKKSAFPQGVTSGVTSESTSSATPYDDIINLPHHKSETYPWMPEADRAAQFAPFAALVGFDEMIRQVTKEHEDSVD